MSRSKFSYQQEIEELKRALIAKDKEIERIKFGTLTFYDTVTQLDADTNIDIIDYGFPKYKSMVEYTLTIRLNRANTDIRKIMDVPNLKFTAELDNES